MLIRVPEYTSLSEAIYFIYNATHTILKGSDNNLVYTELFLFCFLSGLFNHFKKSNLESKSSERALLITSKERIFCVLLQKRKHVL